MSPLSKLTGSQEKNDALEEAHLMEDNSSTESDPPFAQRKRRSAVIGILVPWTLSAVLLVLLVASWAFERSDEYTSSNFERGFSTELSQ